MDQRNIVVEFSAVNKAFSLPNGSALQVLRSVSFQISAGEIVALVGESGSGKSTIARLMLGLTPPDSGEIRLAGKRVEGLHPRQRPSRPGIQPVFQDSSAAFNPRRRVLDALAQADRLNANPIGDQKRRIAELLEQVGLSPGSSYFGRYPHELSGGQRQRLAIARALAADPDVIVADEPLSGADVSIRGQVLNLLLDLRRSRNISMLFVTHDIAVARFFADRAIVLFRGEVVESGVAKHILFNPAHDYTKSLIAAVPKPTF